MSPVLFDSNLIVYALNSDSPHHSSTKKLISRLLSKGTRIVFAQQNIMEAHKAMVLGYKVNIEASLADILDLKLKLGARYISPKESTLDVYKKLVIERKSDRKFDFFDYYLAATMISNDVKTIYTANAKDFGEIKGIRAINPL